MRTHSRFGQRTAFVLVQTSGILVPQTLVCWNQALRTMGQNGSPAPRAPLHPPSLALSPVSDQAFFHGTHGSHELTKPSSFVPVLGICPLLVIPMCDCDVTVWYMVHGCVLDAQDYAHSSSKNSCCWTPRIKGFGCWHPGLGKTRLRTRVNRQQCEMAWVREQGHLGHKPGA